MEISDKASKDARDRDYKFHREKFGLIIAKFAQKFAEKDESKHDKLNTSSSSISPSAAAAAANDEDPMSVLGKHIAFIPDLTIDTIYILIRFLGSIGLTIENQNYLALLRHFHKMKYK
jgi:hypothetical protein